MGSFKALLDNTRLYDTLLGYRHLEHVADVYLLIIATHREKRPSALELRLLQELKGYISRMSLSHVYVTWASAYRKTLVQRAGDQFGFLSKDRNLPFMESPIAELLIEVDKEVKGLACGFDVILPWIYESIVTKEEQPEGFSLSIPWNRYSHYGLIKNRVILGNLSKFATQQDLLNNDMIIFDSVKSPAESKKTSTVPDEEIQGSANENPEATPQFTPMYKLAARDSLVLFRVSSFVGEKLMKTFGHIRRYLQTSPRKHFDPKITEKEVFLKPAQNDCMLLDAILHQTLYLREYGEISGLSFKIVHLPKFVRSRVFFEAKEDLEKSTTTNRLMVQLTENNQEGADAYIIEGGGKIGEGTDPNPMPLRRTVSASSLLQNTGHFAVFENLVDHKLKRGTLIGSDIVNMLLPAHFVYEVPLVHMQISTQVINMNSIPGAGKVLH